MYWWQESPYGIIRIGRNPLGFALSFTGCLGIRVAVQQAVFLLKQEEKSLEDHHRADDVLTTASDDRDRQKDYPLCIPGHPYGPDALFYSRGRMGEYRAAS